MAKTTLFNNVTTVGADTIEVFYTSPTTLATLITSFSAVNNTSSNKSYKAYIYDSSGALVNAIIPLKVVIRNRFDLGASITNQIVPIGGSIRIESNAINSIAFSASGETL